MSLRKFRKHRSPPMLDLTGASDIIFTLLLFYILTQNFLPSIDVVLPEISSVKTETSLAQRIYVFPDGNFGYASKTVSLDELRANPADFFTTLSSTRPVLIMVDKTAPAGGVIELMDVLSGLGFTNLGFQGNLNENDS